MHRPDHGPDHSGGGVVSIKQLSAQYSAAFTLTMQHELAAHERALRGQHELIGIGTHNLPANCVVRGDDGTEPKPQYVPMDPQHEATCCTGPGPPTAALATACMAALEGLAIYMAGEPHDELVGRTGRARFA